MKLTSDTSQHNIFTKHLMFDYVKKTCSDTWTIESLTDNGKQYTIQRLNVECSCALTCSDCSICIHMYTCTCLDATLHCTICKHVHLLSMCDTDSDASENGRQTSQEQGSEIHDTTDMQTESSVNFSTQRYFSNVLNRDGANVHMLSKK